MNKFLIAVTLFIVIVALGIGCSAAQPDADPDKDGLNNTEEEELGTDPNEPDTDGDGLNDGYEVKASSGFETDPLNNDTDGDSLEDNREILWACDPTDRDTNDDGVEDGKEVNERLTYPYADIGEKDSDEDGLPNGAETHEIHTDPGSKSTDGDRYSDGMEYFGHQGGVDLPGYVDRNPFMPSTPDIAISVNPDAKLVLAKTITVGGKTITSGEQSTSSEASAGISTTLGASTEISYEVKTGWPPWKSGGEATSRSSLRFEIEARGTLSTGKQSRHATLSEWEDAEYTDLSGSKLRTTVNIKNIGNDMLTSEVDELLLNCYLGRDDDPFWTWMLSEHPTEVYNLMPGEEATFVIEIPINFDEFKRFDSGEALTIAINHYSFGEDQRWLENAKSRCAIIDVDYGNGTLKRQYIPVTRGGKTLYDAYNTFGNITLRNDTIASIDGKKIITEKSPYMWWSFYFQNKAQEDVSENVTNTTLLPGDHLLLKYEVDTDGDYLSDEYEILIGTDKDVVDTDYDGLTDYDEVLIYFTNPRLLDTDGDQYGDGTEINKETDPNDPSKKPSDEMPQIDMSSILLYEDLGEGDSEAGDLFGYSVATGNFNNDDYDDLVIGVPFEDIGDKKDVGAVDVVNGYRNGLIASELMFRYPNMGTFEANDQFGYSIATGDFNKDGYDDLVVSVPFKGKSSAGVVNVINGSNDGLEETYSVWSQSLGIGGTSEKADHFGKSVATGDFDENGCDDLAIGVPDEDYMGENAGAVNVIYGYPNQGLKAADSVWTQNSPNVGGGSEAFDQFGYSLATGDFNGDGKDDLAIGVPGEDYKGYNTGVVHVLYGSRYGGLKGIDYFWYQDLDIGGSSEAGDQFGYSLEIEGIDYFWLGKGGSSEAGDQFGYSLATGDFNGDGKDDLAIGVPFEDIGDKNDAGAVNVLEGSREGLKAADSIKIWYQDLGIGDSSEAGDQFGYSLATGDFNRDGYDDLAVGVPCEDIGDKNDAGAVSFLYGSTTGLEAPDFFWYQNLGTNDSSEAGDKFGYSLATGDFNGDGKDDLAVGVPFEDIDDKTDVGAVNVLYIVPGPGEAMGNESDAGAANVTSPTMFSSGAGIGNESDAGEVSELYEL